MSVSAPPLQMSEASVFESELLPLLERFSGPPIDIPATLRSALEAHFGTDLSALRVFASGLPALACANGLAFGDDIHLLPQFADVKRPRNMALLLHEITHVLQQRRGMVHAATSGSDAHAKTRIRLEEEARDSERFADAVLARSINCTVVPLKRRQRESCSLDHRAIQLSQGWEVELHFVKLAMLKIGSTSWSLVPLSSDHEYGIDLFRIEPTDVPEIDIVIDHGAYPAGHVYCGEFYGVPEIVTKPIKRRKIANTPACQALCNETLEITRLFKAFILELNKKGQKFAFLYDFAPYYNTNKNPQARPIVSLVDSSDIAIDIVRSCNAVGQGNPPISYYYAQYNATVPIESLCSKAGALADGAISNEERYQGRRAAWMESVAAAPKITQVEQFEFADTGIPLERLNGAMALAIYYMRSVFSLVSDLTPALPGTKCGKGGFLSKNKFSLLPKTSIVEMFRGCLDDSEKAALRRVIENPDTKAALYQMICDAAKIDLRATYGDTSWPFENGGNPRERLHVMFYDSAYVDDNTGFLSWLLNKPAQRRIIRTFTVLQTWTREIDLRVTGNPIDLTRNEESQDDDWPYPVIRNVVFESRMGPGCKYAMQALADEGDAGLQNLQNYLDNMIRTWDAAYDVDGENDDL